MWLQPCGNTRKSLLSTTSSTCREPTKKQAIAPSFFIVRIRADQLQRYLLADRRRSICVWERRSHATSWQLFCTRWDTPSALRTPTFREINGETRNWTRAVWIRPKAHSPPHSCPVILLTRMEDQCSVRMIRTVFSLQGGSRGFDDCFFSRLRVGELHRYGCVPKRPLIFELKHGIEVRVLRMLKQDENLDVNARDADGLKHCIMRFQWVYTRR